MFALPYTDDFAQQESIRQAIQMDLFLQLDVTSEKT
jgi:hypothetical protein